MVVARSMFQLTMNLGPFMRTRGVAHYMMLLAGQCRGSISRIPLQIRSLKPLRMMSFRWRQEMKRRCPHLVVHYWAAGPRLSPLPVRSLLRRMIRRNLSKLTTPWVRWKWKKAKTRWFAWWLKMRREIACPMSPLFSDVKARRTVKMPRW